MNHQQTLTNFENNNNPSQVEVANAYYARDQDMNLSFKDQFEWAMKKLNYNPSTYDNFRKNQFRRRVDKLVEDFLNDPTQNGTIQLVQIREQVTNDVESIINLRRQRWHHFKTIFENNNHLGFYQTMDTSELAYLGY